MFEQVWEVVGGIDKGGIIVREGEDLKSAQLPERLCTGALIKELECRQERIRYELITGCGPSTGWVSVSLKGKALLAKRDRSAQLETTKTGCESLGSLRKEVRQLFGPLSERTQIQEVLIPQQSKLRVMTISDIHVDYPANRKWFADHLPSPGNDYNVLILPGDVSDSMDRLRETLQMFVDSFDLVCFTPGNHDLWIRKSESVSDSMEKFRQIIETCDELSVCTRPVRLRSEGRADVLIVPLLSFYSDKWDREPEMPWFPDDDALDAWMDFRTIKWPDALIDEVKQREGVFRFSVKEGTSAGIGDIFSDCNEPWLQEIGDAASDRVTISFSHYLPRQELFPPKRFLLNPHLHKVSGSISLESQIRRLQPNVHVFGHTHLTVDCVIEDQRYVQWALGNPGEQKLMTLAVASTGMLVLYDSSEEPKIPPVQTTFWGRFFQSQPRDVNETCPGPFVRKTLSERYKDIELPMDDEYFKTTPGPGPSIDNYDGLFEKRWRQ